jgi:hypothetical protein
VAGAEDWIGGTERRNEMCDSGDRCVQVRPRRNRKWVEATLSLVSHFDGGFGGESAELDGASVANWAADR